MRAQVTQRTLNPAIFISLTRSNLNSSPLPRIYSPLKINDSTRTPFFHYGSFVEDAPRKFLNLLFGKGPNVRVYGRPRRHTKCQRSHILPLSLQVGARKLSRVTNSQLLTIQPTNTRVGVKSHVTEGDNFLPVSMPELLGHSSRASMIRYTGPRSGSETTFLDIPPKCHHWVFVCRA